MQLVLKERQQAQPSQLHLKRKLFPLLSRRLLNIVGNQILHCAFQRIIKCRYLSGSEYGEELLLCLADEGVALEFGE
jgi:hypothetical protein